MPALSRARRSNHHPASHRLTLWDRLSRLTYRQACKLLGEDGPALIRAGGAWELDLDEQVELDRHHFCLTLPGATRAADVQVSIRLQPDARDGLSLSCSACTVACEHSGAALALILEEKSLLGLAEPPPEHVPAELLDGAALIRRALDERAARAASEKMRMRTVDSQRPWTDYLVTSEHSGKSYRVALRGPERGDSYCSCPDFRKNTLGTCKHILHVQRKVNRRFPQSQRRRPYVRKQLSVFLHYGERTELRLGEPAKLRPEARAVLAPLLGVPVTDIHDLVERLRKLERLDEPVTIYPDAEAHIQQLLRLAHIKRIAGEMQKRPADHPLRFTLLKAPLLPYQLEGIAFAAAAGRALLADEMGLGKTVQAIGLAELLAREVGIDRVLVICPASVKAQWRAEVQRFSGRSCQLVLGKAAERAEQYRTPTFFTVCNYEQVLRDITAIDRARWDLIILDEGQRIKNWEAKTSGMIKGLRSPFALVLSGTPLENRVEELYSVVEFIDDRRLGPAFSFLHRHRVVNEQGKVLGYKNLGKLRAALRPVLLRRTRAAVIKELPPRTTEIVRLRPTDEQAVLHGTHIRVAASIARKRYISEMDLLRLQKALLMCRLAADSTFLVDKQSPGFSSKLEYLDDLFARLGEEPQRKAVVFSEWTTMLDLLEARLVRHGLSYVRLDGSVPQKKRQQLVAQFQRDLGCQLFLTTNAGATGLNLQAANTVINVDLPWNPAVLEQRIGRTHRMGQERPVHVFVLVTEETIEESLLATLSAKSALALAALDPDSAVDTLDLISNMEELRRRLEVLLGAQPSAPIDESEQRCREEETRRLQQERVAEAGGKLLTAAFDFLGQLLPAAPVTPQAEQMAQLLKKQLSGCINLTDTGTPQLTVSLPDPTALDGFVETMARVIAANTRALVPEAAPRQEHHS